MSGEKMGRGVPPGWPGILSAEKAYGPKAYGPIGAAQLERGALKTSGVAQEAKASGPVALGGSAFGPKPPADRMEALLDVVSAKTPAGKLAALEAGHRSGHITATEYIEWANADGSVADEAMRQVRDGARFGDSDGGTGGGKLMRKPVVNVEATRRAQEAEKRRASNALAGAHARLADTPPPEWHHADVVATWRDIIGDLSEALERWHDLHTPCNCGPNEECGKCPMGES